MLEPEEAPAWAEVGDVVYDGTCKGFFQGEGYYVVMRAQPVQRFGRRAAAELILRQQVYGPCDELEQAERRAREQHKPIPRIRSFNCVELLGMVSSARN